MPKAKWIISLAGSDRKGGIGDGPAAVYTKEDLDRRLAAAKKAGVKVAVRKAPE